MTVVNVKPAIVRKHLMHPARTSVVYNNHRAIKSTPDVNVVETTDNFRIEVAAPGLEKSDFTVNVDKDLLTISASKEHTRADQEQVRKLEFNYGTFQRSFRLPETVETGAIEASYTNGILCVTLPKKEEAKPRPARTIEIA